MVQEHYLKNAELVGEQLRYLAEHQGQWVALFTWNAAAFNLRDRERWIGWTPAQKKRRLSHRQMQALLDWLHHVLGPVAPQDDQVPRAPTRFRPLQRCCAGPRSKASG